MVQINTEISPALSARFGVRGIPVIMLLRSGKVVDRLEGAQTAEAILAWFRRRH